MRLFLRNFILLSIFFMGTGFSIQAQDASPAQSVVMGCTEDGWVLMGEKDFVPVNGDKNTWIWKDGLLTCSGLPIGVMRSAKQYTNFEYSLEWRHLKSAGNSGTFAWVPAKAFEGLPPGKLPSSGIEVQILDHGYKEFFKKQSGKDGDWFTTNGDIFAVGSSKLTPFPPLSPDGSRSFPRKNLSKGYGEWNKYYVRCINGELRLWVNGSEISGGNNADPKTGYLCLESEGSPIEFKNIKIRELP